VRDEVIWVDPVGVLPRWVGFDWDSGGCGRDGKERVSLGVSEGLDEEG